MSDVDVTIDDRARLVAAVLAASDWPEREQAQEPHAVHPHAKQTRRFVRPFSQHTAVTKTNQVLAENVAVDLLFTAALRCTWPTFEPSEPLPPPLSDGEWVKALADFNRDTAVADAFWPTHEEQWAEARSDLVAIFRNSQLADFLGQLRDRPLARLIAIMPNLVYPALSPALADTKTTYFLIMPPPKAVGESPPWPFREDAGWVAAQAVQRLVGYLLAGTLAELGTVEQATFIQAATVLFLEQELDETESQAYLVRCTREFRLPELPEAVATLREYLAVPDGRTLLDLKF